MVSNNQFIHLNHDDVVLFEKDTFKVNRLRDLLKQQIRKKLQNQIYCEQNKNPNGWILEMFSELYISDESISVSEIQYNSVKDCQVLRVGSKGWQIGKLIIQICIAPHNSKEDEVRLVFYAEEFTETELLFDDIRDMMKF